MSRRTRTSPMEGMDDLRRALEAAVTGPVEPQGPGEKPDGRARLPSKALHPEDQGTLEMQARVTESIIAIEVFLKLHVEHEHLAPVRALRAALCDLTEAKVSALLEPVKTKARPTASNPLWPQPFRTLKIIVAALIRIGMDGGEKKRVAATRVRRALQAHKIDQALLAGPLFGKRKLSNIERWDEEDAVAHELPKLLGGMRAIREKRAAETIKEFTDHCLGEWVREAAGRGVIRKRDEKARHASK
jgi:hypothetical protein